MNKKDDVIKLNFTFSKTNLIKGLIVVALVFSVLGLAFWASSSYGAGTSYDFTSIDIDTYLDYLNDDEMRIVYISRPNCPHCVRETPILKKVAAENNLTIYYLNTIDFYDDSIEDYTEDGYKLINSTAEFSEGISTPNILIVQSGKVVDRIEGEAPASDLTDLFTRNGFINE